MCFSFKFANIIKGQKLLLLALPEKILKLGFLFLLQVSAIDGISVVKAADQWACVQSRSPRELW